MDNAEERYLRSISKSLEKISESLDRIASGYVRGDSGEASIPEKKMSYKDFYFSKDDKE